MLISKSITKQGGSFFARMPGFTLIELIMIIAVVGILTAISLPQIGGSDFFEKLKCRTVGHHITSDIRYTRRLAITNGKDYRINFDFGAHTYDVEHDVGGTWTSVGQDYPKTVESEVTLSGINIFEFDKLGGATLHGVLNMSIGAQNRTITVDEITGSVVLE